MHIALKIMYEQQLEKLLRQLLFPFLFVCFFFFWETRAAPESRHARRVSQNLRRARAAKNSRKPGDGSRRFSEFSARSSGLASFARSHLP